jgi:hypothetical protein
LEELRFVIFIHPLKNFNGRHMAMRSKTDQGKQVRFTLEDTLRYQDRLKEKLKILISENRPLEYRERKPFFEILTKGLLSQGCTYPVYFVKDDGWFIFASAQNLAQRIADVKTNKLKLKTNRPEKVEIIVDISELWQFLYDKFLFLFPQACSEALHISAESIERPKQGSYKFSSKGDLS